MVYGRYNELVFMGFINQLITGGHHPVGVSPVKLDDLDGLFHGKSYQTG